MTANQEIRHRLRAKLIEKGSNLQQWTRRNGYKTATPNRVLSRYAGSAKRPTKGSVSEAIIEALEAETGVKVCGENFAG